MRGLMSAKQPEILAVIPARSGSKGVPRKNLMPVGGKPLLAWTVEAALNSKRVTRTLVSTDDEEIASVAQLHGAEVPFRRPAYLAGDNVHAANVVIQAMDYLKYEEKYWPDYVAMLLPTSPLRTSVDIDGAAERLIHSCAPSIIGVAETSPYGSLRYVNKEHIEFLEDDFDPNFQRQDVRVLYTVNGSIFIARAGVLKEYGTFHIASCLAYPMAKSHSIDVNTNEDLRIVEALMK